MTVVDTNIGTLFPFKSDLFLRLQDSEVLDYSTPRPHPPFSLVPHPRDVPSTSGTKGPEWGPDEGWEQKKGYP